MATECCGKSRETPFCPLCGKPLASDRGLGALLAHCRKTARNLDREQERLRLAADEAGHEHCRLWADDKLALSRKWKAWADALAELLASRE